MNKMMNNKSALDFFEKIKSKAKENPNCVKMAKNTDYTNLDAKFILNYANKNSEILDLGSGTGLIINKIYDKVRLIDCVEPFIEFSAHIVKNENVSVHNINVLDYKTNKKYDIISAFGLLQYFNEKESLCIYNKCFNWLKPNGKIIVKNQFGVTEDVTVAGYSAEQKNDYFSQYRYIEKEIKMLENVGYKEIQKFDIYPSEANRWDNTHFYAIVATK